MKKYILVLGLMTLSMSSCSKFLDIKPVGKVIPTTLEEYQALLRKAYSARYEDRGLLELRTDIALVRDNEYDQSSYNDIQLWNDNAPTTGTQPYGWATYYSSLYYANAVIHNAGAISGGSQEEVNQLVGEAYMLRAWLHFNLVNLYGQPYTKAGAAQALSVPIKLDLDLEGTPSRASVEEVYKAILADIATARTLLNVKAFDEPSKVYHFNTLSADALEARVYLYQGNWAKSLEASERVLASKPELQDLRAKFALPNRYDAVELIAAPEQTYTSATARAVRATAEFYNSYSDDDLRKTLYYEQSMNGASPLGYYTVKKDDGSSQYRSTFRTAEFYLTSAEAAAEGGNLELARQRLLSLLEKRYTAEGYAREGQKIKAMNVSDLLTEIRLERKKELAFEGHYWFDLRRTTRPSITKQVNDKAYTLSADDARYTLPIPSEAIASNPSLRQQ